MHSDFSGLEPWFKKHQRRSWIPIVRGEDKSILDSKFGGMPLVTKHAPWPTCPACHNIMSFFFQLNIGSIPENLGIGSQNEMIQLFYCLNNINDLACEFVYAAGSPFSPSVLVRRIATEKSEDMYINRDVKLLAPARSIYGWRELADFPSQAEHDELGLLWNFDWNHPKSSGKIGSSQASEEASLTLECPLLNLRLTDVDITLAEDKLERCHTGEKLLGWPYWIQNVGYPACKICNKPMSYIFQIGSCENLNFMFGDWGTGHIFSCQEHADILTFAWSSH